MPIIRIFSGTYCRAEEVIAKVSEKLGLEVIDDRTVIRESVRRFQDQENKLLKTLAGKVSAFDNFTHERERNISHLKIILSEMIERDNILLVGSAGHLIPRDISHVLSVCLIAEIGYRYEQAMKDKSMSGKDAQKVISRDDEGHKLWCEYLFRRSPWDSELYDMLIPMNKSTVDEAVGLIVEHATGDVLKPTGTSRGAVEDFKLVAKAEVALGKEGHDVLVSAQKGVVTLTINKHTLMLSRLEDELKKIVGRVEGMKDVKTKVGPGFYQTDIYRRFDFEVPSRVLLVDDEKEFVQTLSERLVLRDMGTAVVYDGEQALSFVEEEPPDVMVLDLKMPGIDGIEVLRRIKKDHPDIEVIILTGHGTEKDRELCMELGAFAYLQKPVDIEKLSITMKDAYDKIKQKKS